MTMMGACAVSGTDPNVSVPAVTGFAYGFGRPAVAIVRFSSDRKVYGGGVQTDGTTRLDEFGAWCVPGATPGDYDIRARPAEGDGPAPAGPMNAWLNMATDHEWTLTDSVPNTGNADGGTLATAFIVEIRKTSTGRIVALGSAALWAQRYS